MLTEEQRLNRLNGLGASDSSIVMGFSTYKTPYELYLEKTGIISSNNEITELQYWGNMLEKCILKRFEEENSVVLEYPDTVYHPEYPFIFANLDAYEPISNMVVEAKNSNSFMRSEWDEGIPLPYIIQIAKQVAVTNANGGYCCVLIGGCEYRQFIYERDLELESMIIESDIAFWDCVQNGIEPKLLTISDAMRKYLEATKGKQIVAAPELQDCIDSLVFTKMNLTYMTKRQDMAKLAIMTYMGDADTLVDDEGKVICTWKNNKHGTRTFLIK